jgi:hypothetical protein
MRWQAQDAYDPAAKRCDDRCRGTSDTTSGHTIAPHSATSSDLSPLPAYYARIKLRAGLLGQQRRARCRPGLDVRVVQVDVEVDDTEPGLGLYAYTTVDRLYGGIPLFANVDPAPGDIPIDEVRDIAMSALAIRKGS